jgi:uncharacterized protein (DUF305 family)
VRFDEVVEMEAQMQDLSSRLLKSFLVASAGLLTLSACAMGSANSESVADPHAGHIMDQGGDKADSEFGQMDIMFAQMMIPHHQGAIEMTSMIEGSDNQEVRLLAESIVRSQTEQIELMQELLAK